MYSYVVWYSLVRLFFTSSVIICLFLFLRIMIISGSTWDIDEGSDVDQQRVQEPFRHPPQRLQLGAVPQVGSRTS